MGTPACEAIDFASGDAFHLSVTAFDNRLKHAIANVTIAANLRARLFPPPDTTPVVIDADFQIRNELLELRGENLFDERPGAILETFLHWEHHPEVKGLAASTRR